MSAKVIARVRRVGSIENDLSAEEANHKIINQKQHTEHLQEEPFGCLISKFLNDLLKTDYLPHDGRDSRLGFPGVEDFSEGFVGQNLHGFGKGE